MSKNLRKHRLKLGIFLSYRSPEEGGGFTITNDILNSVLKSNQNHADLKFIILNDKNEILKKQINNLGYDCYTLRESFILLKIKSFFFSFFPNFLKIYNFLGLNQYLNVQKKNNIDLVWFISAEYYYPLFSKYISTVWDLQHITHSSFPETGGFFRKIYREQVISSFLINSFKIISGSNVLIKIMKNYYNINSKKIIYNHHPTPKIFIKKKKSKSKINNLNNFFIYPANFWRHKNHLNLFEGFRNFNIQNKNKFKLVLVGDIKDKKYFKEIKKNFYKNFSKNFKILNFVKIDHLIRLYDNCLALVYSSYAGPENLPPLEAMARRKPIICSNYDGAKEQLQNIPIYFDPSSPKSIEDALNQFKKKKFKVKYLIKPTEKYIQNIFDKLKVN